MEKRKDYFLGIVGLGYVGLPLACLFAEKYRVRGYDPDRKRIASLNEGTDSTNEMLPGELGKALANGISFTSDAGEISECNVYIVCVPTPVDEHMQPDLRPLLNASRTVGGLLKKGDTVVYESTVYPGVTEDICVPELCSASGLEYNRDFFVGYSPERINPGDREHTVRNIRKITSGSTPASAGEIDALYASVIEGGTFPAASIKVAESAKVLENAQRDINIAFMNEVARIFNALDIDTHSVLDAAGSKWNFLPFKPGLVGGHCIGVDPYYLIQKAQLHGVSPRLLLETRRINDSMGSYVAHKVIDRLCLGAVRVRDCKVLLLGFTFKENCPDIRNTKVIDVYRTLEGFVPEITVFDPWADSAQVEEEYGVKTVADKDALVTHGYDVIVHCVAHSDFAGMDLKGLLREGGFVYDVKGTIRTDAPLYRL